MAESPGTAAKAQAFYSGVGSPDSTLPTLPNPALTPGDTLAVTAGDVCQPGYAHAVRNVPSSVKSSVYQSYGILHHARGQFEVDHLISLELGGSNSVKNLWPESYQTQPWNARVKDQLEDRLHDDVCSQQMELAAAQQAISGNWIESVQARVPHADAAHRDAVRQAQRQTKTSGATNWCEPPTSRRTQARIALRRRRLQASATPNAAHDRAGTDCVAFRREPGRGLGEYPLPQVFLSQFPLLRQNQAGPVHDRVRSSGRWVHSG